jgi:hypothetical protein
MSRRDIAILILMLAIGWAVIYVVLELIIGIPLGLPRAWR